MCYKENIGSTEMIDKALTSGQVKMYPEYTGVVLTVASDANRPKTAKETYEHAKAV